MSGYHNLPVCDLRHINDLETIRQIEGIHNVAVLVHAKDASDEIKNALEKIPKHNVASTVYLDKNADIHMMNGITELNDGDFKTASDSVFIINGIAVIGPVSKEKTASVIFNGILAIHESLKKNCALTFLIKNGVMAYADFDSHKLYPNKMILDAGTLSYLKPKTMLVAGNSIHVEKDITADMLKEKQAILFAGNEISCYADAAPYIRATATCGNDIKVMSE